MTSRGLRRPPPVWPEDRLEHDRQRAIAEFRRERLDEPLGTYMSAFDEYKDRVQWLLAATADLTHITANALSLLTDNRLLEAFRYLAGPPISEDDLTTLAQASTLAPGRLRRDPDLEQRVISVVLAGLDRRRFPWVSEGRRPSEREREAAILASATLMAANRTGTERRSQGKNEQEAAVSALLVSKGFARVPRRQIGSLGDAPAPGEFCGECRLGTRNADLVVRLWDTRLMGIECKVSNSFINSIKRLNNDAAVKARVWIEDFGRLQIVPAAMLSGLYNLRHLSEAQARGLTLFWAHDLATIGDWLDESS